MCKALRVACCGATLRRMFLAFRFAFDVAEMEVGAVQIEFRLDEKQTQWGAGGTSKDERRKKSTRIPSVAGSFAGYAFDIECEPSSRA